MTPSEKFFIDKIKNGILSVYDDGRVFNNKTNRFIGSRNSRGYVQISMADKNRKDLKHLSVHRLVWTYFNGIIPKDKIINHIDGNKTNNKLSNLELSTASENGTHAYEYNLNTGTRGQLNGNARFKNSEILEIRKLHKNGISGAELTRIYKVSSNTISRIINNKSYIL